jgi:hypothetical protein
VIVCLRAITVPPTQRERYPAAVDYHPITRYEAVGGYTTASLPEEVSS